MMRPFGRSARQMRLLSALAASLWAGVVLLSGQPAAAAENPFYKGKMIRIIVGLSPGGGFDAYSRLLGRHMGKHIPGNPRFVVQNMTGAGSLISANYLYNKAKPDGLTLGHYLGSLAMAEALGQRGIRFDSNKFIYVGAPVTDHPVCAFTRKSGVTDMGKWLNAREPVKVGGHAYGAHTPDNASLVVNEAIGAPTQLVTGYG